ncbi:hypothetical protein ACO0RG_000264 [Hanseniaspora osmophila]
MSNSDHSSFPGPVSILPAESELASTTSSSSSSEEEYFLLNDLVNNDLNIFVEKTNQGTTSASPPSSTSSSLHKNQAYLSKKDKGKKNKDQLFDFKKGNVSFHIRHLTTSTNDAKKDKSPGDAKTDEQTDQTASFLDNGNKSIILDDISVDIPESCICGIIGGSGSGKTTLLNYLMNTYNNNINSKNVLNSIKSKLPFQNYALHTEGDYYIKSTEYDDRYDGSDLKHKSSAKNEIRIAYLQQYDFLPNDLTPLEILTYTADLKLNHFSKEKKAEIVEMLLMELGLKDCKHIMISNAASQSNSGGDSSKTKSTLSGGEKRRLGIAIQMISNPKILFLDEPTTGLDSYSAILLLNTLKKLCKLYGTTFILSIHQPRADIFSKYLDQLIILSTGKLVYCDRADKMIDYFTDQCNIPLPLNFLNPCDYYIDQCSIDNRSSDLYQESSQRLGKLERIWKSYRTLHEIEKEVITDDNSSNNELHNNGRVLKNVVFVNPHVNRWKQIQVQFKRTLKLSWRDHWTFVGVYLEPIVIACITGWIFYRPVKSINRDLPESQQPNSSQIRTLSASLYTAGALQGYLFLLFETYRLCSTDIKLYDMERLKTNRVITPFTFLVARKLAKFLLEDLIVPFILSIITYFMYGLNSSHGNHNSTFVNFLIYFSIILVNHQVSTNLALLSVSISRNFAQASLVGNLFYTLQSIAGGFFVNSKEMPVYVRWTKYITFFWPSFGALISNEFTDSSLTTYNQFVVSLGFPLHWITAPIIIVLCWAIGFILVAWMIFNMVTFDFNQINSSNIKFQSKTTRKQHGTDIEKSSLSSDTESIVESKEVLKFDLTEEEEQKSKAAIKKGLDIELKDFSLRFKEKYILNNVNAYFPKNQLNVIMGPSGSGKSTLLNVISNRVGHSSNYKMDGTIYLANTAIEPRELNKYCSYVKQHEDHLLSRLTVWETLYYAGRLRLPDLEDKEIRSRVEQLIMDLGLWHCKDVLIGDEFNKGISGGEKKRVSIGVQLLTSPEIILLDEPTSGLDSFTASTMMNLLKKISERTTVIATIHQPRSEIFEAFANVLLLSKYGKVAFNGSPFAMKDFFMNNLHYKCPKLTNIADFYLDLISLNTQNDTNERISQLRVDSILKEWEAYRSTHLLNPNSAHNDYGNKFGAVPHRETKTVPLYTIYQICLIRQFKNLVRDLDPLVARLVQVPAMGIILALYFSPLKHRGTSAILNRFGLVQQATSLYFVGMLSNLAIYPGERNFFYNEFQDGVHGGSLLPFFCSYLTIELPMSVFGSLIYTIFSVLVTGLPRNATNFFWTFYGVFIFVTCGESLGILTNTLFPQPGFVVNSISICISLGCCMSGIMSLNMDVVLKVINWFSPMNFVIITLINHAFPESLQIKLDPQTIITGREILQNYGIYKSKDYYMIYATLVMIGYRLLAFVVLWWKLRSLR